MFVWVSVCHVGASLGVCLFASLCVSVFLYSCNCAFVYNDICVFCVGLCLFLRVLYVCLVGCLYVNTNVWV